MLRTNFIILNKLFSSGLHILSPEAHPELEYSVYINGKRIVSNDVLTWTVDQYCELEVQYVHLKQKPWIIYKNLGVNEDGIIKIQFVPDTPTGRAAALDYIAQVEAKKLKQIEKTIRVPGKIFKFPLGTALRQAVCARQFLGF